VRVGSADELLPLLYEELRQLAHARLSAGGRNVILDTTALVHESFLRLQKAGHLGLADRNHFLAYAASTMRSIVIDSIRRRRSERHGGDAVHVTLGTHGASELGASEEEILEVHDALGFLAKVNPRLAQVVEMRYFLGLTDGEIGGVLGTTDRTVRRDWERARLLLASMMGR
jgi:RNA polymerase sigma factor (TIGR02999 family)